MSFEEKYFEERNPTLEPKHTYEVEIWINYFDLKPNDKVFVHGCGYGQRVHCFIEQGIDAIGMDISEYVIDNSYGLSEGKIISHIPIDEKFKLVVSVDVLEHLPDEILLKDLPKLAEIAPIGLYGITAVDNENFYRDKTHINPKFMSEWKDLLNKYYKNVYDAPQYFYAASIYLICE